MADSDPADQSVATEPAAAPAAEAFAVETAVAAPSTSTAADVGAARDAAPAVAQGATEGGEPAAEGGEADANNKRKQEGNGDGEPELKRVNNSDANPAEGEAEVTETMSMNKSRVGKLIGKGGTNIKHIQMQSGAHIKVDQNTTAEERIVTLIGQAAKVALGKKMIHDLLDAPEPTAATVSAPAAPAINQVKKQVECPMHIVGKIIGRGGETIRSLQTASGAHILINQSFPEGHPRQVELSGPEDAVERAHKMVAEIINSEGSITTSEVITKYGTGENKVVQSPKHMIGRVIGRAGETVKQLQKHFGVNIQIDQVSNPCTITISGQPGSVGAAERAVIDLVEDRPSPFGGGMPPGGAAGPGGGFGGPGGGFGGGPPAYGGYGPGSGYPGYGSYGGMPAYGGMPYAQPAYGMPYGAPQYAPQYPQAYPQPAYGAHAALPQNVLAHNVQAYPQPAYGAHAAPATSSPVAAQQYGGQQYGQQQQYAAPAAAPAAGGDGGGWQELRDEQGRPYYFNAATGVSQWERPAGM